MSMQDLLTIRALLICLQRPASTQDCVYMLFFSPLVFGDSAPQCAILLSDRFTCDCDEFIQISPSFPLFHVLDIDARKN
jgi:hypothetical protein